MRYSWLDGLRGLAALYVLVHHAAFEVPRQKMRWWLLRGTEWLEHGHMAVAVFIVLSGYCLMLPVTRSADGQLRGGILDYLRRRARRILPPYYAALALSIALMLLVPALHYKGNGRWLVANPASWKKSVVTHLFLVHNYRREWAFSFDPPMWSVASEWQIYFLFPVLLWVWRRQGMAATVAFAFLASLPLTLARGTLAMTGMCPWYLGLFACGMAAACRGKPGPARGWPGTLIIAAGVATVLLFYGALFILLDILMGAATAALLAYCGERDGEAGPRALTLRILESPPAVGLGAFSYSLYLVHYPLLSLASNLMMARNFGTNLYFLIMMLVVCPLVLAASYGFSLVFERPFLSHPARATPSALKGPSRRPARSRVSTGP
jgi:peptidoglycan/LPS O-acetylase OafA/YrhL